MSDSTSIKLRDGLKERIASIAEDDRRSANWIMNEAIEKYTDWRERRRRLRDELRAAHEDYARTGLHLTQAEVEAWMAKRAKGERAPMPKLHT